MAYFHTTVLDNQIKALPTVDTASGEIATFDTDLTENLVEVKCQIVAKQASGTPSPDNPLPITTYSELNFGLTKKNFVIKTITGTNVNAEGKIINYSSTDLQVAPIKEGETYVISTQDISGAVYAFYTTEPKLNSISYNGARIISSTIFTFTAPISGYVAFRSNTGYATSQLEIGTTATTYEPFGVSYNIPFGQTVANGVLDVTTGKLRVTHGIVDLGSLNYSQGFSGFYTTGIKDFVEIPSTVAGSQLLCSIFSVGNTANNDNMYIQFAPSYLGWVVFLPSTSYATASDFKTAMSGINLVYKLATPIEIQLDSITLQALLNENNIWCDTGDTEVKYLLTMGKKIS